MEPSLRGLESLEETLAILSKPELVAEIRGARADLARGRGKVLTEAEARALVTGVSAT